MTDQRPLRDRVLNLVVFAPVGVFRRVRDDLPALVATGRREVEDRVRVARWVGEMAVTYGRTEVQRRLSQATFTTATDVVPEDLTPPFEGYDDLPAERLVQLLVNLPSADLERIRSYEAGQRGRRTVLAKIDQLIDV